MNKDNINIKDNNIFPRAFILLYRLVVLPFPGILVPFMPVTSLRREINLENQLMIFADSIRDSLHNSWMVGVISIIFLSPLRSLEKTTSTITELSSFGIVLTIVVLLTWGLRVASLLGLIKDTRIEYPLY